MGSSACFLTFLPSMHKQRFQHVLDAADTRLIKVAAQPHFSCDHASYHPCRELASPCLQVSPGQKAALQMPCARRSILAAWPSPPVAFWPVLGAGPKARPAHLPVPCSAHQREHKDALLFPVVLTAA